jgi:hypothetical protein
MYGKGIDIWICNYPIFRYDSVSSIFCKGVACSCPRFFLPSGGSFLSHRLQLGLPHTGSSFDLWRNGPMALGFFVLSYTLK